MRHATAATETMENNSFTVTDLYKICTHCERLSKKVREKENTWQMFLTVNACF